MIHAIPFNMGFAVGLYSKDRLNYSGILSFLSPFYQCGDGGVVWTQAAVFMLQSDFFRQPWFGIIGKVVYALLLNSVAK
ncbi:hypothetical protein [Paralysiella testudinis]|uniref:Uncharacterized protein n=1 Tax=Paralysiella testudinis TaxID=2809020 RepID=A0A892ZLH3_9NEIS|nr:hypothetical protein [Paralysiella testudinis]QRQ82637.1 hypothetical protein JQU52_04405 [Paralysiella testudinis]